MSLCQDIESPVIEATMGIGIHIIQALMVIGSYVSRADMVIIGSHVNRADMINGSHAIHAVMGEHSLRRVLRIFRSGRIYYYKYFVYIFSNSE